MLKIMNHAYGIEIHSTRGKCRRPWVGDRISLTVVGGIFRINTAHHINDTDMGDVVLVEQRVVGNLVQVERGAVHRAIFARQVMDLRGVDTAHTANLRRCLGVAISWETEKILTI